MAFKFKDLMIQVAPGKQGGGDGDPACTLATRVEPAGIVPCTLATMGDRAQGQQARETTAACTLATQGVHPCTLATMYGGYTPVIVGDTTGGVCTLATMFPFQFLLTTTPMTPTLMTTGVLGGGLRSANLADLKAQLRQALEEVEQLERSQEQALPATVEEADELERRLQEALEELKDHRKSLEQAARPAGTQKASKASGKKKK